MLGSVKWVQQVGAGAGTRAAGRPTHPSGGAVPSRASRCASRERGEELVNGEGVSKLSILREIRVEPLLIGHLGTGDVIHGVMELDAATDAGSDVPSFKNQEVRESRRREIGSGSCGSRLRLRSLDIPSNHNPVDNPAMHEPMMPLEWQRGNRPGQGNSEYISVMPASIQ